MRYSQKRLALVTSSLLAAAFATQAIAQAPPSGPVGVVDRDKVVMGYPRAQAAAEELKKSEERVHKLIEDSNKQYEEAKNARKPQAELDGLQRRLQTQIDEEVKKVQAKAQTLETQLENEIDKAIREEAAARKVGTVLMKQAVLLGGLDLTDGVVKRLAVSPAGAQRQQTK